METFLAATAKIGPLEGFRSKAGWPFTAELALVYDEEIANWKLEFDFGEDAKNGRGRRASRWTSLAPAVARRLPQVRGPCLSSTAANYVCEHARSAPTVTCDFKTGKVILHPAHRDRPRCTSCWHNGKTDLLENFVSNKTRRKFKAFLTYDKKEGKVVFEFEPRRQQVPAQGCGR